LELYELIWAKPMKRIVIECGTTMAHLTSVLRRSQIPTPPPGYWTKMEMGKPVQKLPLPPTPEGQDDVIRLGLEESSPAPDVSANREVEQPADKPIVSPSLVRPPASRPTKPTNLSRDQLYDAVWSEPMIRLAERFGISGNGLAKICDRENIPYPPRGYWAKHAVGKASPRTALPQAGSTSHQITIRPTPAPAEPTEIEKGRAP